MKAEKKEDVQKKNEMEIRKEICERKKGTNE